MTHWHVDQRFGIPTDATSTPTASGALLPGCRRSQSCAKVHPVPGRGKPQISSMRCAPKGELSFYLGTTHNDSLPRMHTASKRQDRLTLSTPLLVGTRDAMLACRPVNPHSNGCAGPNEDLDRVVAHHTGDTTSATGHGSSQYGAPALAPRPDAKPETYLLEL